MDPNVKDAIRQFSNVAEGTGLIEEFAGMAPLKLHLAAARADSEAEANRLERLKLYCDECVKAYKEKSNGLFVQNVSYGRNRHSLTEKPLGRLTARGTTSALKTAEGFARTVNHFF